MTPNEQKAAELLREWQCFDSSHGPHRWLATHIVPKLATPDHEAALAACEAFSEKYLPMSREYVLDKDVWMRVHDVGRRSLDAKKPKERWTWYPDGIVCRDGKTMLKFYTPCAAEDASAYAAEQNAKEAGR